MDCKGERGNSDAIRLDHNYLQIKEKLGFREDKIERELGLRKNKFGLHTPYITSFTSQYQELKAHEILTEKF